VELPNVRRRPSRKGEGEYNPPWAIRSQNEQLTRSIREMALLRDPRQLSLVTPTASGFEKETWRTSVVPQTIFTLNARAPSAKSCRGKCLDLREPFNLVKQENF
jgi:hypothetical protein